MSVMITKLVLTEGTQIVCLPEAVAFPEGVKEVEIVVRGDERILRPVKRGISDFLDKHNKPVDWPDRDEPPTTEREWD